MAPLAERAFELNRQGMSPRAIAAVLNITEEQSYAALREPAMSDEDLAEVED